VLGQLSKLSDAEEGKLKQNLEGHANYHTWEAVFGAPDPPGEDGRVSAAIFLPVGFGGLPPLIKHRMLLLPTVQLELHQI